MSDTASEHCKELWREGDYYTPSIYVNKSGGIGINVGGYVIVQPVRDWHEQAQELRRSRSRVDVLEKALREIVEGAKTTEPDDTSDHSAQLHYYLAQIARKALEAIEKPLD